MKKIVIAGGSGFIGKALVRDLSAIGEVVVLSRHPESATGARPNERMVHWDPKSETGEWTREIASADAVVNLAGASIAEGRWNDARKQELVNSRIESTRAIVNVLRREKRERVLINASATGYYGDRGSELLDESSPAGSDFLATLALKWEAEAQRAEGFARVVMLRFGIVLDAAGGALAKTLLPFKLGAGGVLGSGDQYWSWIDLTDVVGLVRWAIENNEASGAINATAPEPVTNREFTKTLAAALHRPAIIPAPAFALRIALGEMADALLLKGQRVLPARAEKLGYKFQHRTLESSLRRIVK